MRNDFCSNYLEHSYKGTTWKDHKYIRKEGDKYIYVDDNGRTVTYADRESAENMQNNMRYLEMHPELEQYYKSYNSSKADIYKNVQNAQKANQISDNGANGMPSSIAKRQKITADMKVEDAVKTYEAQKAIKEINRMLDMKQRYETKGLNGMPSSAVNKATRRVKRVG